MERFRAQRERKIDIGPRRLTRFDMNPMPLTSFVPVAPDSDFPLENLPYGVFRPRAGGPARIGVAIGEYVLDLAVIDEAGLLSATPVGGRGMFAQDSLNAFMAAGPTAWQAVRSVLQRLLTADEPTLRDNQVLRDAALLPQHTIDLLLPAHIGDYTDFYSSLYHASNVGKMLRPDNPPLFPNWRHLPVAYHGRASTVVVSGTPIHRPYGQTKPADSPAPVYGPTRALDFELELGMFIGPGNDLGSPIPIDQAEDHIFGFVLVNDWSARDIQGWEYQPLGPFLAKNFATSISPWVVPLAALEPFRCQGEPQDPPPLPYLQPVRPGHFAITLEVWLNDTRICQSDSRYLYWSCAQQIAHHTVNGCRLRPGDLLASGTISGPDKHTRGCLLELTWRGSEPLTLRDGSQRRWLEDGDTVTMRGWAQGDGYRIGFGAVSGTIRRATLE
ncbi:MAG TPA: fumarylacetoacetase [Chloroflexus aurantiacus]|uniref:fumarylacetoacetase n=2 Tax=Chloroflexus aurantiacus TaxID=1108 RepID=A9WI27_CHLAA|nr:fumarylacetoacetase [Chloroflexus aurantiacus J-10-fl]HBW66318.1 fumarylacetoacetase [Chloroflexus aurantiacus]